LGVGDLEIEVGGLKFEGLGLGGWGFGSSDVDGQGACYSSDSGGVVGSGLGWDGAGVS